jgi:hypothetical protein
MIDPRKQQKLCVTVVLIAHESGYINASNLTYYDVEIDVNYTSSDTLVQVTHNHRRGTVVELCAAWSPRSY